MIVPLTNSSSRFDEGRSFESVGACDPANRFFANHFPGCPVVPGIVMLDWGLEAASRILEGHRTNRAESYQLHGVTGLKFPRFLRPGEPAVIKCELTGRRDDLVFFRMRIKRDGERIANGKLSLRVVTHGEEPSAGCSREAERIEQSSDTLDLTEWRWFDRFELQNDGVAAEAHLRLTQAAGVGASPSATAGQATDEDTTCPAALIVEGLAQAGVELIGDKCPDGLHVALGEIESLDMMRQARIRDRVRLSVEVVEPQSEFRPLEDNYTRIRGVARVDDEDVLRTEFLLSYAQPAITG